MKQFYVPWRTSIVFSLTFLCSILQAGPHEVKTFLYAKKNVVNPTESDFNTLASLLRVGRTDTTKGITEKEKKWIWNPGPPSNPADLPKKIIEFFARGENARLKPQEHKLLKKSLKELPYVPGFTEDVLNRVLLSLPRSSSDGYFFEIKEAVRFANEGKTIEILDHRVPDPENRHKPREIDIIASDPNNVRKGMWCELKCIAWPKRPADKAYPDLMAKLSSEGRQRLKDLTQQRTNLAANIATLRAESSDLTKQINKVMPKLGTKQRLMQQFMQQRDIVNAHNEMFNLKLNYTLIADHIPPAWKTWLESQRIGYEERPYDDWDGIFSSDDESSSDESESDEEQSDDDEEEEQVGAASTSKTLDLDSEEEQDEKEIKLILSPSKSPSIRTKRNRSEISSPQEQTSSSTLPSLQIKRNPGEISSPLKRKRRCPNRK